jgi:hypothetical protein
METNTGGGVEMEIIHEKEASPTDRITIPDWNAAHKITGLYGYGLVEEKVLGVGNTNALFENLTSVLWDKYVLEYFIKASALSAFGIQFNGDTNAANYSQYCQLQEGDGNAHHLTNWGANNCIGRVYNTSPFITVGKAEIVNCGDGYATVQANSVMLSAGWSEFGGWWEYAGAGNLNSIKLLLLEAATFEGKLRLYKLADLSGD